MLDAFAVGESGAVTDLASLERLKKTCNGQLKESCLRTDLLNGVYGGCSFPV